MLKKVTAVLLTAALLGTAPHHAARKARAKQVGKTVLPIALILNGTRMAVNPPPVNYQGHLLVPVRRILTTLGLDFDRTGSRVVTHIGANTVEVTGGVILKNTLYAPLRFFAQALGAQAVFDRQTNSVEIISTLVGRSGNGIVAQDGGVQESGTLSELDIASSPPTLTLTYNASVRTLKLRPDVQVIVQDVNTGTSNAGTLEDVHPGDYAQVRLDREGNVKQLVDAYGSRTGRVAGAGGGSIVLDDGHVIVPSRATTITLNGSNVSIDKIAVNDQVMVRYNIDSSEAREIIATRQSQGSPPPDTGVHITSISFSPVRPLRQGDTIDVVMHGTPGGGVAHYDIGPYLRNNGLKETAPGTYTGSYTIRRHVNFAAAPLFGHLRVGQSDAPEAVSTATLSVATEPPDIVDFAPDNGDTVNNTRPGIYATFAAGAVDVNVSSARIVVNGHDVTSSSVRTARFIEYMPGIDLPGGDVRVTVYVSDLAGNRATKSWTFTVKK